MDYKGEGIAALVSTLDDMQCTNLIMADKKLREVLKCLAYYDEFRAVLSFVNKGFDYPQEKRKALQRVGERSVLRLPKSDVILVALISNMLVEFDEGNADLVSFAGTYFPASTRQESYDAFISGFIEPFKLALVRLVVNGVKEEIPQTERNVEFASNGLANQTQYLLVTFVKSVNEAQIDTMLREDLLVMLEGLAAALDSRDTLMIKAVWLGVKKTLAALKMCPREIEKTDELLKLYLVVK